MDSDQSVNKKRKDDAITHLLYLVFVQLLSRVQLFEISWTAACQTSLSFTISQSLLKLLSIELVMPSNHLILCCPLFLLPSVFPNIMSRLFASGGQSKYCYTLGVSIH